MTDLEQQLFNTSLDFANVTIESIERHAKKIAELYQLTYKQIADLEKQPQKINFNTIIQPIIDLHIFTAKSKALCSFPRRVHTDAAIRDSSNKAFEQLEKIEIEAKADTKIYKIFEQYYNTAYKKEEQLLHEHKRFVEKLNLDYKRNGMHISDPKIIDEIKKIKEQISELAIQFEKNLDNEKSVIILTREALQGMPKTWLLADREIEPGKYKITLKYPDVIPILEYAQNRNTREQIFTAFNSRCAKENIAILTDIIIKRQKLAKLLGYASYADYAMETRMAKNSQNVKTFLDELNEKFTPAFKKNLKTLTEFAQRKENNPVLDLKVYDIRYYMRLLSEDYCHLDMEAIKEYFPEQKVIAGTLAIYEKLLGLKFVEQDKAIENDSTNINQSTNSNSHISENKWHSDAKFYTVFDYNHDTNTQGKKVGQFYLDLHPREGKFGHAAVFEIVSGCDISHITGVEGERMSTVVAMLCNFPKNEGLPFDDVVTFFHEFGHLVHTICSKTKLSEFFAFKVELDFLETPSQMLEYWCYDDRVLKILSEHPVTKEPLAAGVAEKMRALDKLHAGYMYKRQLMLSYLDYTLHTLSEKDVHALNIEKLYQQMHQAYLTLSTIDGDFFPATFGHLVEGYDAGYYSYAMSAIYAADMFDTIFKNNPLSSTAGANYRQKILEPGASEDAMVLIESFLGRKPRVDAFLEYYGL